MERKKVLIIGLGLIGGAYAYRLSKLEGYEVYGTSRRQETVDYAINKGYIVAGSLDPADYIKDMDIIVIGLYPSLILETLKKYNHLFNDKQIITDVCGIKSSYVYKAFELAKPAEYLSHHPMAGKEKVGIKYCEEVVFDGANYIVTPMFGNKLESVEALKKLGADLGFSNIAAVSPEYHDKMIGFTSQLTHAIAVSLVNSDHDENTKNFIGDSYRDLTRIAKINEDLWSELFFENKDLLLHHIVAFEDELDKLKAALKNNDDEALRQLFRNSKKTREAMDK